MGATPPSTAPRSTSGPSTPVAASRPTSSAARTTSSSTIRPSSRRSDCSSTTRPGTADRRPSRERRRRRPPAGPTSPSPSARPRRCGCGCSTAAPTSTASTPTSTTAATTARPTTTGCSSRPASPAPTRSATWPRASGPTSRSPCTGGALDGKTAGMLVKVETLSDDLSRVRLFHTSVSRAIASWSGWPGRAGLHRVRRVPRRGVPHLDRSRLRDPRGGHHQRGHLRRAGPLLVRRRTGRSWSTSPRPTSRTCSWSGMPTTDEFQHQFLGLVTRQLPNGDPNPAYDDVNLDGVKDGRVRAARRLPPHGLPGVRPDPEAGPVAGRSQPDHVRRVRPRLRAAVPGHRRQPGAGGPRSAVDAPDLQLPTAAGETIGKAKACWAGGDGAGLPQPGRSRPGVDRAAAGARGRRGRDRRSRSRRPSSP